MDHKLEKRVTPIAQLIHENTGLRKDEPWSRLPSETQAAYLNLAVNVDTLYRKQHRNRWRRLLGLTR